MTGVSGGSLVEVGCSAGWSGGRGRCRIMSVSLLQGGLLGSALAFSLLVVFSHLVKSPDGGLLFFSAA